MPFRRRRTSREGTNVREDPEKLGGRLMGCSSSLKVMARLVSPESLAEAGPSEEQSDADGHALAKTMEDGNHLVASNQPF